MRRNMEKRNFKLAFTLAEVTIVLILLGTVAAITIPTLVRNNIESINRTKLKKSVALYKSLIKIVIADNRRLTSETKLNEWGSENDCANIRSYFKIVKTGDNGCQFSSDDGVWWDFGANPNGASMTKALVAFKKEDLTKAKAIDEGTNKAFFLMTQFDDKTGAPRVMDVPYAFDKGSSANILNNAKVYAFINKRKLFDYFNFCPDTINTKSCVTVVGGVRRYYNNESKQTVHQTGCSDKGCTGAGIYPSENNIWKDKYTENNYSYVTGNSCSVQGDECKCGEGNNPTNCRSITYVEKADFYSANNPTDITTTSAVKIDALDGYTFTNIGRFHQYANCNEKFDNCVNKDNERVIEQYWATKTAGKKYLVQLTREINGTYTISTHGSIDANDEYHNYDQEVYRGCGSTYSNCTSKVKYNYTPEANGRYSIKEDKTTCPNNSPCLLLSIN